MGTMGTMDHYGVYVVLLQAVADGPGIADENRLHVVRIFSCSLVQMINSPLAYGMREHALGARQQIATRGHESHML